MKIILSGGGTGGHVNPALAIGSVIEKYDPTAEIHYVGTEKGIENKLVPKKYPMHHIEIRGLKRSLSLSNLKTAYLTLTSLHKSKKLLKELKPDAVIGSGGYVCFPICRAAADLGIPCFLHESNAVPGFAVKMLEKKADIIFVNFDKTREQLPLAHHVMHVGTPLREEFYKLTKESARKELALPSEYKNVVLSFGGSLGAEFLNKSIIDLMEHYGKDHPETLFVHATGAYGKEEFFGEFEKRGLSKYKNLVLNEYIYNMPAYMAAADLVICRSGAMTLSELALLKKASILVPSPNVTNDQQTKNAKLLADKGGAVLFKESELTGKLLMEKVEFLLTNREALHKMEEEAGKFAVKDAEEVIYQNICKVIEHKKEGQKK